MGSNRGAVTSGQRAERPPFHVVFNQPVIPPNTGNAIRMCAGTGATLHLAGPLGFNLEEKNLRRAGLDYHDLAVVRQHDNISAAFEYFDQLNRQLGEDRGLGAPTRPRIFAFTTHASTWHTEITYREGDVLLFGTEPSGLPQDVLEDPHVDQLIRIPMLPGRRSMNLSNAAAVAAYETWRQLGFRGA